MSARDATIALQRFGLGARPGDLAKIGGDPNAWLAGQIGTVATPPQLRDVPPAKERVVDLAEARQQKREMKNAADAAPDLTKLKNTVRQGYLSDIAARQRAYLQSDAPFAERWARFWSNHFTVSIARPVIAGLVVPFEVEAIRSHMFGGFTDLTLAALRHPAMLLYLDNALSVGPDSKLGRRKELGLNENLARELMELHTLGVDGGYTQDDVRELAKILTGWTIVRPGRKGPFGKGEPGSFQFLALAHEPGAKTLLGKRYEENGEQEGVTAIHDLVRHPATARHVATKLARHFLADDPPPAAIDVLAATFAETDGDLSALARTLISLPEAWSLPPAKILPPEDWLIAIQRGLGLSDSAGDAKWLAALQQLGQVPFAAPSPAGWPDRAEDWLGPEGLMARLELAHAIAAKLPKAEPTALAQAVFGPTLSDESRLQIERAASRTDAIAMLLVSPEFMLR